jgi:hypothetical protein
MNPWSAPLSPQNILSYLLVSYVWGLQTSVITYIGKWHHRPLKYHPTSIHPRFRHYQFTDITHSSRLLHPLPLIITAMRILNAFSLFSLPLLISCLSLLNPTVAVKISRDVDWMSKTDTTPMVGTTLTRRATEEAAKSDPTTGQGVVTFLQVLQQANIK